MEIKSLSFLLALTHQARQTVLILYISVAKKSFFTKVRITASSNSKAIFESVYIFLSTSLFTAVFSHENEKLSESFSNVTIGNIHSYSAVSDCASSAIIGPPGNQYQSIFATLSNASHAASSRVSHIFSISNNDFQIYNSLCPHDTVSTMFGNAISYLFRSSKLAKICHSI
jgi:hypothetical protein